MGIALPINFFTLTTVMQVTQLINTKAGMIFLYISMQVPFSVFLVYGFIETAEAARAGNMLPLGLAPGATLTRRVAEGEVITRDAVEVDESLAIVHLRRLQDMQLGWD